jgi:two-component system alkaline phosphatase synthesis response regulator PhoP
MPRILAVDDDPKILEAIEKSLSLGRIPFVLTPCRDPSRAVAEAVKLKPDLILLDIRLAGQDGRAVLKALKTHAVTKPIPVIFLTGLAAEGDKVLGLNMGADDYVAKPFGAMELVARIEAVLRRYAPAPTPAGGASSPKRRSNLLMDAENRTAQFNGRPLRLQPREFEILYLLSSNPGRTLGRVFLIENSSSYGMPVSTRSLDTHIKNIRKKLGSHGAAMIETVPKTGYRFNA